MTHKQLARMTLVGLLVVMGVAITGRAEEDTKPQEETATPVEATPPSEPQSQEAAPQQVSEPTTEPGHPAVGGVGDGSADARSATASEAVAIRATAECRTC